MTWDEEGGMGMEVLPLEPVQLPVPLAKEAGKSGGGPGLLGGEALQFRSALHQRPPDALQAPLPGPRPRLHGPTPQLRVEGEGDGKGADLGALEEAPFAGPGTQALALALARPDAVQRPVAQLVEVGQGRRGHEGRQLLAQPCESLLLSSVRQSRGLGGGGGKRWWAKQGTRWVAQSMRK